MAKWSPEKKDIYKVLMTKEEEKQKLQKLESQNEV